MRCGFWLCSWLHRLLTAVGGGAACCRCRRCWGQPAWPGVGGASPWLTDCLSGTVDCAGSLLFETAPWQARSGCAAEPELLRCCGHTTFCGADWLHQRCDCSSFARGGRRTRRASAAPRMLAAYYGGATGVWQLSAVLLELVRHGVVGVGAVSPWRRPRCRAGTRASLGDRGGRLGVGLAAAVACRCNLSQSRPCLNSQLSMTEVKAPDTVSMSKRR